MISEFLKAAFQEPSMKEKVLAILLRRQPESVAVAVDKKCANSVQACQEETPSQDVQTDQLNNAHDMKTIIAVFPESADQHRIEQDSGKFPQQALNSTKSV